MAASGLSTAPAGPAGGGGPAIAPLTSRRWRPLAAPILATLVLVACTRGPSAPAAPTPTLPSPSPVAQSLSNDPVVAVVRRVAPAVVNVTTSLASQNEFGELTPGRGVGTGFIVRSDGVIVTNFHVVEGALGIRVTLPPPDNRTFMARVIGADPDRDLAVLKVDGRGLPTVPLGDSSRLQLGERVIALGYALALEGGPTVTTGIISSLERTVQVQDPNAGVTRTLQDALQTDAAINPGNSGGPLVDLAGNVVGINTAGNTQAENIGFAIAMNDTTRRIIEQAIAHPLAPQAYLGVATDTVTPGLAFQLGLPVDHGAWVRALAPGGPAQRAGIRENDIIVGFAGRAVESQEDLARAILEHRPGDRVRVEVVRPDGTRQGVTVTLGSRPLPAS